MRNLTPAATLRAAVIRQRRSILHEIELEDIHEEVDRRLVLAHNQGDEMEVRHSKSPRRKRRAAPRIQASRIRFGGEVSQITDRD